MLSAPRAPEHEQQRPKRSQKKPKRAANLLQMIRKAGSSRTVVSKMLLVGCLGDGGPMLVHLFPVGLLTPCWSNWFSVKLVVSTGPSCFPVELMAQCWSKLFSGGPRVPTKPNTEKEKEERAPCLYKPYAYAMLMRCLCPSERRSQDAS